MTRFRSCLRQNTWRNKPGIVLAIVVIASTSVLLVVPSPALATSGNTKTSSEFGGYVKHLRGLLQGVPRESAQADVTVPTVTCHEDSNKALVIMQDLTYDEGYYAEAFVWAECESGTATYNAQAVQCGADGCNPLGCATPELVSPGDSITLSESVGGGTESPAIVGVTDNTNGNSAGCLEIQTFPEIAGPVETGMCSPNFGGNAPLGSSVPQNPLCLGGMVPNVTPVMFSGVNVDGKALSFRDPKPGQYGSAAPYDYVSGTRLELKTSNLKDGGESFRMSYAKP